jgi:uncharacterized protein YxeA
MKKVNESIIIVVVVTLIILSALFIIQAFKQSNEERYEAYNKIEIGDTRQQVIDIMGEPNNESTEFHLWQERGYEKEYAEAEESNATTWLYYLLEPDLMGSRQIAAIGLDSNDIVVYKAKGGS